MEIITLIIRMLYRPIRIVVGNARTILISERTYVWGRNNSGQLGLGDTVNKNSPQELSLRKIKSVSCGAFHTIAVTEDDIPYVWGSNSYGQLGLGDYEMRSSPQELKSSFTEERTSRIKSIVCGGYHTVVLISSHCELGSRNSFSSKMYVWGHNEYGQLGLGDTDNRNEPQEFILDHVESVSCGECHTMALMCRGEIYVWGENSQGQLGLGDYNDRVSPQKLTFSLLDIKSVSCGNNSTIALTSEGSLYSWGNNYSRQLGLGDRDRRNVPHEIALCNVKSISCSGNHTVAMTLDSLYVWGYNKQGELGLGDNKSRSLPQKLILNNIKMISCSWGHTIAISKTDDVYIWGNNKFGQLGLGDGSNRNLPCRLNFTF